MPSILPVELATHLESAIIFGDFTPGMRIVEDDIGVRFNVSRSPVREAFRQLEATGLVVREARRGVRVTEMSLSDLDEVYACRMELEALATRQAAANCTEAQARTLDRGFEAMVRAGAAGDIRSYFWENIRFTEHIHDISSNRTLMRLLAGLNRQAMRYRYFAYRSVPEMVEWSMNANRDLTRAVRDNDVQRAGQAARSLVENAWSKIRHALEQDARSDGA